MADSTIPVDLLNPGQVFACLGILEVADVLLGDAAAAFDWNGGRKTTFRVSAAGSISPVERAMRFLEEARIVAHAPSGSSNLEGWKASWGDMPEVNDAGDPFPFPDPNSPATLPVVMRDSTGNEVIIDHWGDATRRDNVKFWAGAQGKPGVAILRESIELVRAKMRHHNDDPFAVSAAQTISFRFDWRRDYIPVQDGFSPNRHKSGILPIFMVGFPLVEIFSVIGMTYARPKRKTKLEYHYGVLGRDKGPLLPPIFHRAALGAETNPIPGRSFRRFVMHLDWPGREGQARCITHVREEEIDR